MASSHHGIALGWASELENATGMKVRLIPEPSSTMTQRWLKDGIVELNALGVSSMLDQINADGSFATKDLGPFDCRIIWMAQVTPFGWATTKTSGIKTPYDIKGKKIGYSTSAVIGFKSMNGLIRWANLTIDDVQPVPVPSYSASARALKEGRVDVAEVVAASAAALEVASGPKGLYYLPMNEKEDPEAAARFREFVPLRQFGQATAGVEEARDVWMEISPMTYVALPELDAEFVYQMAKWNDENFDLYKDKHSLCPTMSIKAVRGFLDSNFWPVHDGLIRYLKEVGMWTSQDDAQQKANVELLHKYIEAYQQALAMAKEKGVKVDPTNDEWMTLWVDYRDSLGLPQPQKVIQ